VARHDEVLDVFGLQRRVPEHLASSLLLEAMSHDKKAHHDLTFVLAGAEGFETVRGVDPQLVSDVLEKFRGEL
jgi:3-dehydroquinate synthetase